MAEEKRNKMLALTLVYVVIALALLLCANLSTVADVVRRVFEIVKPIVYGFIIAYFGNPFFKFFEKKCFYRMRSTALRRLIALVLTGVIIALILVFTVLLILPQLIESVKMFYNNYDNYLTNIVYMINDVMEYFHDPIEAVSGYADWMIDPADVVEGSIFSKQYILSTVYELMPKGSTASVLSAITESYKLILGFVTAFFLLAYKEFLLENIKRILTALFKEKINRDLLHVYNVVRSSFGGFFFGKIIDSLIIGVLTYIVVSLFKMPYTLLVATFVGITNIIPVIGPFIGAIPTSIIVLLAAPSKFIPFLLIILVIQQLDGNVIGPLILGNNTGVSALCVMIAVTVMGSVWGLVGMLVGVPIFATVLILVDEAVERRLEKKSLPIGLTDYYPVNNDVTTGMLVLKPGNDNALWRWELRCENRLNRENFDLNAQKWYVRMNLKMYVFLKKNHILHLPDSEYLVQYSAVTTANKERKGGHY